MQVVSAPKAIKVLAPACTALLNLSSYVPAQVSRVFTRGSILRSTGSGSCGLCWG